MRVRDRVVRTCASLTLMAALLWPAPGFADHEHIPDPAPRSTQARLPGGLGLDRTAVTVSGLSSGGFYAHQFHLPHSTPATGAGIVAGGSRGCAEAIPNPYQPYTAAGGEHRMAGGLLHA